MMWVRSEVFPRGLSCRAQERLFSPVRHACKDTESNEGSFPPGRRLQAPRLSPYLGCHRVSGLVAPAGFTECLEPPHD